MVELVFGNHAAFRETVLQQRGRGGGYPVSASFASPPRGVTVSAAQIPR
jgi:hypothetical protein